MDARLPGCVQDDGFANGFGVAAPNGFAVSPWMSFLLQTTTPQWMMDLPSKTMA